MPVSAFAAESIALESDVDLPSGADPGQLADALQGNGALGERHDLQSKVVFELVPPLLDLRSRTVDSGAGRWRRR